VISLSQAETNGRFLYEKVYCARGDIKNRIKECQGDLFADRTSTATMLANQLRLWFASMAYALLSALRRIALAHTQFAEATCGTIPAEAPQDRRAGHHQRATHPLRHGFGLPLRPGVAARRRKARSGPHLSRLTGVAACAKSTRFKPQANRRNRTPSGKPTRKRRNVLMRTTRGEICRLKT
jgi:Transposase DDE domain group 1